MFDDIGVKAKVTFSDECASDILQLINKKFFDFVVVAMLVRSFSRAAVDRAWRPRPSRQGSCPLGHKEVSFNTIIKHDNENLELDFSLTCCAAAFSQSVACVLLHQQSLGSVTFTQPASIWDFGETRDLLDWKGTFAGAAYSCDLCSHDMPKPLRLLSNIEHLRHFVWKVGQNFKSKDYRGPLPRNFRCKVPEHTNGRQQRRAQGQWLLPLSLLVFTAQLHQHIDGKDTVTEFPPETDIDMHNTLQTTGPETDIGMYNIGPAPCLSTALSPPVFGLQRWLEVVVVEGFWFVKFARKGAGFRTPTGYYHHRPVWLHPVRKGASCRQQPGVTAPFGDGNTQAKPGTNDPVGSPGCPPGGGPGERVPLYHSSGCPLLLSERLFVSSLPEGEEAGRAGGMLFDFGFLRFIQFLRGAFSATGRISNTALPLFNFDWQPGDFTFLKTSIGRRSQLLPRPPGRSPGKRVSGRSVGLSFPRARA